MKEKKMVKITCWVSQDEVTLTDDEVNLIESDLNNFTVSDKLTMKLPDGRFDSREYSFSAFVPHGIPWHRAVAFWERACHNALTRWQDSVYRRYQRTEDKGILKVTDKL